VKSKGELRLNRSGKHIVIVVDDDVEIREALESLLKSADFDAAVFSSGESALGYGQLAEASCLISDVRMPGMHGLELQWRVKSKYPALPVIIITGHRDEQIRQSALSEGAAFHFYKPFDPDDLLRAVRSAITDSEKAV
jgi:FixJ family two-component response regulator